MAHESGLHKDGRSKAVSSKISARQEQDAKLSEHIVIIDRSRFSYETREYPIHLRLQICPERGEGPKHSLDIESTRSMSSISVCKVCQGTDNSRFLQVRSFMFRDRAREEIKQPYRRNLSSPVLEVWMMSKLKTTQGQSQTNFL